jgi:hypothetical protein
MWRKCHSVDFVLVDFFETRVFLIIWSPQRLERKPLTTTICVRLESDRRLADAEYPGEHGGCVLALRPQA